MYSVVNASSLTFLGKGYVSSWAHPIWYFLSVVLFLLAVETEFVGGET